MPDPTSCILLFQAAFQSTPSDIRFGFRLEVAFLVEKVGFLLPSLFFGKFCFEDRNEAGVEASPDRLYLLL